MRLFHGTNVEFTEIDLAQCLPYKDFGQGFYLTDILDQATRMAQRKSYRYGLPIVQHYDFDETQLTSGALAVKIFEEPSEEWARFIMANRERKATPFCHGFDIVVGPVADDGVAYILSRYLEGSKTIDEVVRDLQFSHLNRQFCFCTPISLTHLLRVEP